LNFRSKSTVFTIDIDVGDGVVDAAAIGGGTVSSGAVISGAVSGDASGGATLDRREKTTASVAAVGLLIRIGDGVRIGDIESLIKRK